MNTTPESDDLTKTIVHAVNARVEAQVAAALSGDEFIGRMVSAALQRQVEVPSRGGYGKDKVPFLSHVIEQAIRDAAKSAVAKVITEDAERIEDEVRKHVRRVAPEFASKMVGQLVETASSSYGIQVTLRTGRD